jgi:hypothetical protein
MRSSTITSLAPLLCLLAGCTADFVEDDLILVEEPSEEEPSEEEELPEGCEHCDGVTPDVITEKDTVCFPGDGAELCLPVYQLDPVPEELVYGDGPGETYFNSNPQVPRDNYRAPTMFLDLEEVFAEHGDDVKIYPNFRLDEIGQRRVGRWAVIQPHAYQHLQELRTALGPTSVVSGYRSPGYNASGGGAGRASNSRHLWGDAFDFDPPVDLQVAKAKCEEMGAYFINLYTTHIHCDWRHRPVDERFFGPSMIARRAIRSSDHDAVAAYQADIVSHGSALEVTHQGFDEGQPVIEWHALDALGNSIAAGSGQYFTPPPGTVSAHVTVAGWLVQTVEL